MLKYFLLMLLLLFLSCGIASAEFYQWEDENGNVHITDYPPPTKSIKNIRIHKYDEGSEKEPRQTKSKVASSETQTKKLSNKEVILYTTSWCPYCKMARDYFQSRAISFTEYDIEKDRAAADRKKKLSPGSGVPLVIIDGQQINGYSPSAYDKTMQ